MPRCPSSVGAARGQEVALLTRTALQTTRAIVFLSNLVQILTSCNKMNVKSADICSISQYTEVYFILPTDEKRIHPFHFNFVDTMDLLHNDVKRGKRDVRRNLIDLKRTFIIAEPIKFRVSSWKPHLTSYEKRLF